ncbi:transposase, partial [Planktomarina sp.]|uniref:transposase n=1 Tax=Planktomarina sp. TaxID=2024851 RepID=UPI003C725111
MDPIRRSPYRPAAFEKPTSQGLTEDRTRSRARKVENFLHYGRQPQKRYSDEDVLKLLREIDVHLHDGLDVVSACRKAGISDKSYYYWRKKFGGLSRSQVSEMKSLK